MNVTLATIDNMLAAGISIDQVIVPNDADNDGMSDEFEEPVTGAEPVDHSKGGPPKKGFFKALGEAVRGRNKAGKALYAVLGTAGSVLAGFNIDPLLGLFTENATGMIPIMNTTMQIDIWNIVLMLIASVITLVTTRGLVKGIINDVAQELDDVIKAIQKARQPESPGGKELTHEERILILKEADDIAVLLWNRLVKSRVLRFLGLEKKPEKGTAK